MWKSVQALRGVAALMVLTFHALGVWGLIPKIGAETNQLQAGVDIFFVISGFVMATATYGKHMTRADFLAARLQRIVPLYWLALMVQMAIDFIDPRGVPPLGDIVQAYLFIPYRDSRTHELLPFLAPGWTLSYELYFYALFCLTLHMKPKLQIALLTGIFLFAVLLRKMIGDSHPIAFRLTSPLPFEFLAGMVLAHIVRERTFPKGIGIFLVVIGLLLLLSPFHRLARTAGFGLPALCLVGGSAILESWFRKPAWHSIEIVGDMSYSLYLTHPFVIWLLHYNCPGLSWAVGLPVILVAAIVLAWVTHRLVELPIAQTFKRMKARSQAFQQ